MTAPGWEKRGTAQVATDRISSVGLFYYSGDDCQLRESEIAVPRHFKKAFIFRESAFTSSS